MVHTRNGSNYSVQLDGCGHGRGKNKSRSVKSSSRKTHLEDSRIAPHFPRPVPTNFDMNSESGLIHDNISRAEPVSSGSNRNLSIPIQKLVQRSQRTGVGNMPKPLAGGHELLLTHQELSGSGEDHTTLRRLEPIVFQRKSQKNKNWLKKKSLLSIDQKKELEMTPALETEGPVESTSSKPAPEVSKDKLKGPQKKQKCPKNHQGKGKVKANWHGPYLQEYRIPKLEPSDMYSVLNMARTLIEFTSKEQERMNRTFPHK
ncbi:hypothetical protein O181_119561 [Austropuccinia psidii MF-1]|uniref:Uncharacterized protein n=1 Tax=Austropuccinia psidii MF-1 TaxID=1389203 RepID=A0A9Q3PZS4_9BASI|nr:hypothetical protein [Austropuccinia psidii MF-1]